MIYFRKRMPRNKENVAQDKKVILSPEVFQDMKREQRRNPPLAREAVARMVAQEANEKKHKEKSIKEALRELKAEDEIQRSADEGELQQVTVDELEKSFGLDKMEEGVDARIERTKKILGSKASEIWETITTEKTVHKPLEPARATEYVNAVADLVDKEQGLKIRNLNKKFGLPEAYDPIMGSGASRPTAMRSLARTRVAATETVGSITGMPSTERVMEHRGAKITLSKPDVGTYRFTGRTVEAPTTREDLENALIARYGVEPSQVYFKLGEVKPGVATRMQNDPEYQRWVMELRKATGEMVKEEARLRESVSRRFHRPQDEAAAMKEGMAWLAKGMKDAEALEEEKFFEAGDRMTREAEEQRRNLLELREELHDEIAELLKQKRTPAVQKQIEAKSRQIARAEARLRGEEGAAMPERVSFKERLKEFWKGLFAKKEMRTMEERKEEPMSEESRPEEERALGTVNELLKTDAGFRDAFQHVLNAMPGGEPRAAIDMVHKKLGLPFDRTPNAAIQTPKAIEYVEALAGVLAAKTRGASKAQGEAVARLMNLNRELDVTDKDAFWKKFMENHLAGWLWKKERSEPAPRTEEIKEEPKEDKNPPGMPDVRTKTGIPRVIVGDEEVPAVREVRKRPQKKTAAEPPPAVEAPKQPAKETGPRPPTDAEIESRALLEFQRTLDNEHVEKRRNQALQYLLADFRKRAEGEQFSGNYPGWTEEHYAKAANDLRAAIRDWKKPMEQPKKAPEPTPEIKQKRLPSRIEVVEDVESEIKDRLDIAEADPEDATEYFTELTEFVGALERGKNVSETMFGKQRLIGDAYRGWTVKDFQKLRDRLESATTPTRRKTKKQRPAAAE